MTRDSTCCLILTEPGHDRQILLKIHLKVHENPSYVSRIIFLLPDGRTERLSCANDGPYQLFCTSKPAGTGWGPIYFGDSCNPGTQRSFNRPESTDSPEESATDTPNTAQPQYLVHRFGSKRSATSTSVCQFKQINLFCINNRLSPTWPTNRTAAVTCGSLINYTSPWLPTQTIRKAPRSAQCTNVMNSTCALCLAGHSESTWSDYVTSRCCQQSYRIGWACNTHGKLTVH